MSTTIKTLTSPEELFKKSKKVGATSIEKGILLVKQALVLAQKQSKHDLVFDLLLCIIKSCRFQGKGFECLEYCHKANRLLNRRFPSDTIKRSLLYREFGTLYSNAFHDHASGLEYTLKSLSMNNPDLIGALSNNIGTTYSYLGQFDKALPYLKKAKQACIDEDNKLHLPYVHASFAEFYHLQNKIPEAILSYKAGIVAANEAYRYVSNIHNVAYIHSYNVLGLAELYLKTKEYSSLTKQIEEVYKHSGKFSLDGVHSDTMILEGKMYLALKEEAFFKELFNRAITFCEEKDLVDALDFWYSKMIELCESKNKYKEALLYSKALIKNKERKTAKTENLKIVGVLKDKEVEILELENRNREIQIQRDQLEQVAYIVAHDLKTPLQNISHFISLFLRKYQNELNSEHKFYLDFAIDNSKKLHLMLDELLIYFSIHEIKASHSATDLRILLPKIIQENKTFISKKKGIITYNNLLTVNMQSNHICFVLSRMIKNGLKFSRNGIPPKINIEVIELAKEHRIQISDNGIGLDSKYKHQIFDLFKQLDKNNYSGIGMSLAICKKIIGLYGGTIQVNSNSDNGVTFEFNIPK